MPTQPSSVWQREWQAFWLAVGFLTRVPMLVRIDYTPALMSQSSVYFPLVGLFLGGIYAALFSLLTLLWPPLACLLLVLCFHLWLTGAFHEDGLADSVDALGGGYTIADRLRIMKDSRIGTYGSVALVLALGLKVALLMAVEHIWLALLVSPCIARLAPLLLMRGLSYVTDPDTSKSRPVAEHFSTIRLIAAIAFVVLVCIALTPWAPSLPLAALVAVALVFVAWGRTLKTDLGGYTGDALGASVVFCELLLLLWLSVGSRHL